VNYLILAAGVGRRLGKNNNGLPKCLIEIGSETVIERLLRQIRENDRNPLINIVLGYKFKEIMPKLGNCNVIINPFFDITSILASLWFAKDCFQDEILVINGDIVFSDELIKDLISDKNHSFITLDSRIKNDKEINVRVEGDKAVRLSVKYKNYTGVYAGVLKFDKEASKLFIELIDKRIKRGFNDSNSYYFAPLRNMINKFGTEFYAFDFAGYDWAEIDYFKDIEEAKKLANQALTIL
jgi:L-glutamine-phosphate cytidylyltransferase